MSLKTRMAAAKAKVAALSRQLQQAEAEQSALQEEHSGDRPSPEQARLIKRQKFSYTVHFERSKSLRKVRSPYRPGPTCRSIRRFSSRKEAEQHGRRFVKIGRHRGYEVVKVSKRANAWINWRTGKTNPVL